MEIKKSKVKSKPAPEKPYKFVFVVSGWARWGIDNKAIASVQRAEDDLKKEAVNIDEDLAEFGALENVNVDVMRLDEKTLVQEYSYEVHVTLPVNRIMDFERLLNRDEGCEFDDYSWGDFITSRSGIGSPAYLIQENERSYGEARSEVQLKKLWRAINAQIYVD